MNNTSKNDVGIWVDEVCGVLIGHALFIESLCPDSKPMHTVVRWRQPDKTRFGYSDGTMPLYYGLIKQPQRKLHLFGVGEAAWGAFHREHVLSDLQFPVPITAMVVIVEKETVERSLIRAAQNPNVKANTCVQRVEWYLDWISQKEQTSLRHCRDWLSNGPILSRGVSSTIQFGGICTDNSWPVVIRQFHF